MSEIRKYIDELVQEWESTEGYYEVDGSRTAHALRTGPRAGITTRGREILSLRLAGVCVGKIFPQRGGTKRMPHRKWKRHEYERWDRDKSLSQAPPTNRPVEGHDNRVSGLG